jgi:hypothetical protein
LNPPPSPTPLTLAPAQAASIRSETGQREFPIFNAVNARFLPPDVLEAVHCAADHAATSLIGFDFNLLHFACWGKAPAETLQEIIRLAPLSPSQRDNGRRIPLHFGASSKAAMEVLLSCSPPDAPRSKSNTGNTPLHSFAHYWDPKVEVCLLFFAHTARAVHFPVPIK